MCWEDIHIQRKVTYRYRTIALAIGASIKIGNAKGRVSLAVSGTFNVGPTTIIAPHATIAPSGTEEANATLGGWNINGYEPNLLLRMQDFGQMLQGPFLITMGAVATTVTIVEGFLEYP